MAITALPPAPSRAAPSTFSDLADAFLAALATFVTETNATAVAMNLNDTTDTSTTSVAIGTGAKSFTVSASKSFQPGMFIVIADTAAPSTNAMVGQITSYNSGTGALVVNVLFVRGSGTKTDWIITMTGGISTNQDLSTTASPTFVAVNANVTGDLTGNVSGGSVSATTGVFSSTVTATQPYFLAQFTSDVLNVTGDDTYYNLTGALWTEIADVGSNLSNGTFTAPSTGKYLFSAIFLLAGVTDSFPFGYLITSNRTYYLGNSGMNNHHYGFTHISSAQIVDMDIGDTAYLQLCAPSGTKIVDVYQDTTFAGYKLP